jgi:hypothetical protein
MFLRGLQTGERLISTRLIFTLHLVANQKISLLAQHTASPEPGWGLPVKSRKILSLKMTRINYLQDSLKTSKPIFEV